MNKLKVIQDKHVLAEINDSGLFSFEEIGDMIEVLWPGKFPEWVKALKSGQYKPVTRQLKTDAGHCCLGVLCEIEGVESTRNELGYWRFGTESEVLPRELSERLGITTSGRFRWSGRNLGYDLGNYEALLAWAREKYSD